VTDTEHLVQLLRDLGTAQRAFETSQERLLDAIYAERPDMGTERTLVEAKAEIVMAILDELQTALRQASDKHEG
jgi:hypothetical protein